jgi:cellulose biosynthesis protein BcsQ
MPTSDTVKGKIITFYSYKGGTGRSMALANVAWILAMTGKRVLTIDWDLEAPGLHRYFEPFLADKNLCESSGLIDFVLEFASAAVSQPPEESSTDWYVPYTNLLAHAISLDWEFPDNGLIDFIPSGTQDAVYSARVNSFDWRQFYEKLGGGVFLEEVKSRLRDRYDFILIDSRTGVSDTAGITTIQMPDELVVCFTLNRQSILGASMAAISAAAQRKDPDGASTLKVWPVPTRVETTSEMERLELARALARTRFSTSLQRLAPDAEDRYWSEVEVPYFPYYAFDEVLAVFADNPTAPSSLLIFMKRLTAYLCGSPADFFFTMDGTLREKGLGLFKQRSATEQMEELGLLADEYESLRARMPAGSRRTHLMTALVNRAQLIAGQKDIGAVAEVFFRREKDGSRLVGLALARKDPQRRHVEIVLNGIGESRSAFEQYQALMLAQALVPKLDPSAADKVLSVIDSQIGKTIDRNDMGRLSLAQTLLKSGRPKISHEAEPPPNSGHSSEIAGIPYVLIECKTTASFVRYHDPAEEHGLFVVTRREHDLVIPPSFLIGQYLVTNELFLQFVRDGGYENENWWAVARGRRTQFVTRDGKSLGPASWFDAHDFPEGKERHPVGGISYAEACAFVTWCNHTAPPPSDRSWALPLEDAWELAARTESGLTYPWGDAFDADRCNSVEQGRGETTAVDAYPAGASKIGCHDMAGNLWEFVDAEDRGMFCVLRGGSYTNNRYEVRSYLRLIRVPEWHRPLDFGFRLTQLGTSRHSSAAGRSSFRAK